MTLLQPAKFFAGPLDSALVQQAAHVQAGDLVLMSKLPESAAEAERINVAVKEYIRRKK